MLSGGLCLNFCLSAEGHLLSLWTDVPRLMQMWNKAGLPRPFMEITSFVCLQEAVTNGLLIVAARIVAALRSVGGGLMPLFSINSLFQGVRESLNYLLSLLLLWLNYWTRVQLVPKNTVAKLCVMQAELVLWPAHNDPWTPLLARNTLL